MFDRNYGQKTLRQTNKREKIRNDKKTTEMTKQNTSEEKNNKNRTPEALTSNQEKDIKEETNPKNG